MLTKVGLAGYVRSGPPVGSFLAATFLLPFWLTSEIIQATWREWTKALALVAMWAMILGGIGVLASQGSLPQQRATENPSASPSAVPPTPNSPSTPGATSTVTAAPSASTTIVTPMSPGSSNPELSGLKIAPEGLREGYDRDLFDHWIDQDGDGCDARDEVLIEESLERVTVGPECQLSGGRWYSVYDGVTTTNPSTFDVDHFVPLAEAWDSGASGWSPSLREDFANDLGYAGSLIAVTASSNRSKSDSDPASWQPPERSYGCTYARTWIAVKDRWKLTANSAEVDALHTMLAMC